MNYSPHTATCCKGWSPLERLEEHLEGLGSELGSVLGRPALTPAGRGFLRAPEVLLRAETAGYSRSRDSAFCRCSWDKWRLQVPEIPPWACLLKPYAPGPQGSYLPVLCRLSQVQL